MDSDKSTFELNNFLHTENTEHSDPSPGSKPDIGLMGVALQK